MRRGILLFWLGVLSLLAVYALMYSADMRLADGLLQRMRSETGTLREQTAVEVIQAELVLPQPRPSVLVQVWGIVRGRSQANAVRSHVEARIDADLELHLEMSHPDEESLHNLWEMAAIIDSEFAASVHVRLANRAGDRSAAALALGRSASQLMQDPLYGDVAAVLEAWTSLENAGYGPHWFIWAARQTPPQQRALADAQLAVTASLDRRLSVNDVEGAHAAWRVLQGMHADDIPASLIAKYAALTRYQLLPTAAIISSILITLALFGGLFWCFSLMVRGRRAFDAGAETIENIEPIEFETDAITLQREQTSEETHVD